MISFLFPKEIILNWKLEKNNSFIFLKNTKANLHRQPFETSYKSYNEHFEYPQNANLKSNLARECKMKHKKKKKGQILHTKTKSTIPNDSQKQHLFGFIVDFRLFLHDNC